MTVVATRDAAVDANLAAREAVIEVGLRTFLDVGRELIVIRAQRLYYQDYSTFEDYCKQRWAFSPSRASRLIDAAETVEAMLPIGNTPMPTNEGQARELSGLTPQTAADVMTKAHEDGAKVTAATIREARQQTVAADFIEKYPPLDHYADNPKRVIATGTQLDTFTPTELPGRLDNLAKHIAAEQRSASEPPKPAVPDYYAMTDAMFVAANALCQAIDKQGGADTLTAALANADPADAQLWADQFASAVTKLSALTNVARPTIRRVK